MSYKVQAWSWCADYCKKNQWNPYDSYFWNKANLEYRRQHNIFEAGDLIFDLSDDDEKYTGQILAVSEIGLDFLVCYDKQGKRFCVITDDAVHATDAEIQVGHRLDLEILHDHDIPPNTIILER